MENLDNELMQLINIIDRQQLNDLLKELQGEKFKHLVDYITSLLSA